MHSVPMFSASQDAATKQIQRDRTVPRSSQWSRAGEEELRGTLCQQGGSARGPPLLGGQKETDGWVLLPDPDFSHPGCGLKPSGFGVFMFCFIGAFFFLSL